MLCLTLKKKNTMFVSDGNGNVILEFTIVDIDRNQVKLAFTAKPEIVIDRESVHFQKTGQTPTKYIPRGH